MAHRSWPENIPESKRKWNEAFYKPFDEMDTAALGLRFTLHMPVTAMFPPGHWELFKMALDLAQAEALVPLSGQRQKLIKQIARKTDPLVAAVSLLLTSCFDSKVPLSEPKESKPDDRLTGVWRFRGDGGENLAKFVAGVGDTLFWKDGLRLERVK